MVEPQPSKLKTTDRYRSPAPDSVRSLSLVKRRLIWRRTWVRIPPLCGSPVASTVFDAKNASAVGSSLTIRIRPPMQKKDEEHTLGGPQLWAIGVGAQLLMERLSRASTVFDATAGVAQLVERQLAMLKVVGSSPITRSSRPHRSPLARGSSASQRSCDRWGRHFCPLM